MQVAELSSEMLARGLPRALSTARRHGGVCWRAGPKASPGTACDPIVRRLATVKATPLQEGFFAPAEFSPHTRCLIGWVWNEQIWPWKAAKAKKAGPMQVGGEETSGPSSQLV